MCSFLVWPGSRLLPQIRKGTRVLDDFLGEPARPELPARLGVIVALATMRTDVDLVKKQIQNSHKTNFRDALDGKAPNEDLSRVEDELTEHRRETAEWTPRFACTEFHSAPHRITTPQPQARGRHGPGLGKNMRDFD